MKWIIENRKWLFSGVGVAIIVAVWGLFFSSDQPVDQSTQNIAKTEINKNTAINATDTEISSAVTGDNSPAIVASEINNSPVTIIYGNPASPAITGNAAESPADVPHRSDGIVVQLSNDTYAIVDVIVINNVVNAPLLIAKVGSRETADDILVPIIRAKLIQEFESFTFEELRSSRSKLEPELRKKLGAIAEPYGIGVESVTIGSVSKSSNPNNG